MKTILKNRANKPAPPASSAEPEKTPPKFTPRGGSSKNRILIAVKDNKIDFAAMSPESAKLFNDLMHDADVQAQFGIGPLTQGFDPRNCKRIYEALGLVMMGAGKFAFKWPNEALAKLAYTEQEKDELAGPTANVLDELAPKWLRENQALAALVLVFTAMTQNKLREAAMVAAMIKKQQQAGTQPATPAQESTPAQPVSRRAPIPIVETAAPGNGAATPAKDFATETGFGPTVTGAGPRQTMH